MFWIEFHGPNGRIEVGDLTEEGVTHGQFLCRKMLSKLGAKASEDESLTAIAEELTDLIAALGPDDYPDASK